MGCNEARAHLTFPWVHLDAEIRDCLEKDYDVNFNKLGELVFEESERDIYVENGIFSFSGEVCYGNLPELEKLLVAKEVPFDRYTYSDYGVSPEKRIFRPNFNPFPNPGPMDSPHFDHTYPLDDDGINTVVSVEKVRELIAPGVQEALTAGKRSDPWNGVLKLQAYLDETFPTYPPLEKLVPEFEAEQINLRAAIEAICTVDFSRFPGLYDKIPWAELEAAAAGE